MEFVSLIPAQRGSRPLAAGLPGDPSRDTKPPRGGPSPRPGQRISSTSQDAWSRPGRAEPAEQPVLEIRSAQVRRWSAVLLREDVTCLVLHGMDGIGKSALAQQIAARVRRARPGIELTVVDEPDIGTEDIDTALAASGKALITCRAPFETTSPGVVFRRVGPLTRSGAEEFALSLPNLRALTDSERERIWRLVAGHPAAMKRLDERLLTERYPSIGTRLSAAVSAMTGRPAERVEPTELPARLAESIAATALELLHDPVQAGSSVHTRQRPALRRSAKRRLALAAAIALAIAAAGFAAFRSEPHASPRAAAGRAAAPGRVPSARNSPRDLATAWIAAQLAPRTTVSCDPAFCAALPRTVAEIPVAKAPTAAVIVATPRLRADLGSRLQTLAPVILATFGTAAGRIDLRLVAADGAKTQAAALSSDRAQRRRAGNLLLGNPSLGLSAAARGQLAAGEVDARLLIALAALVQSQTVTVIRFSDSGPGADPDVPLRAALISGPNAPITAFFKTQSGLFRPKVLAFHGRVLVQFSAPFPLGLLDQP